MSDESGRRKELQDIERLMGRVDALRAKARSTEFPAEAEALTAKAKELAAMVEEKTKSLPACSVCGEQHDIPWVKRDDFVSQMFPSSGGAQAGRTTSVNAAVFFDGRRWVNGVIINQKEQDIVEPMYRWDDYSD